MRAITCGGAGGKHGKSFKYESFYNMEDLVILLSQKAWCSWAVPRRMAVLEPRTLKSMEGLESMERLKKTSLACHTWEAWKS